MKLNVHYIDAFTESLFKGNPAAVIISDTWLSDDLMQSIAVENNLSETAFSVKTGDSYHIRWFSPLTEIEFCGHATLATAYVLFNQYSKIKSITFYAKAVGELEVDKAQDGFIQMRFPNRMPEPVDDIPEALIDGLSIKPDEVYLNQQAYFAVYGDEDPVTGSIHTGLAPFWSERLGKHELRAYQASKRGGELLCKVDRDRVFIQGKAVRYLSGSIEI